MKGINTYITEMSAIHNRDNDSIQKQIHDLEKQIQNNTADDKKRILAAAGVSGKNATVSRTNKNGQVTLKKFPIIKSVDQTA